MKNTYVYVPDKPTLDNIKNDLYSESMSNGNISIVQPDCSKKNSASIASDPHIIKTRDFIPAVLRGIITGLSMSILTCVSMYLIKIEYIEVTFSLFIKISMLFVLLGAFFSSLIGVSVKHPDVEYFNKELKKGGYLLIFRVGTKRDALFYKKYLTDKYTNIKVLVDDFLKVGTTVNSC